MTKPVKPNEISKIKASNIPKEVILVFNDLIIKNFNGHSARVVQDEAAKLAAELLGISTCQLYENNWMDVESTFEEAGWDVEYDKAHYSDNYDSYFKFSPKTTRVS
jgi:hypothetical protein